MMKKKEWQTPLVCEIEIGMTQGGGSWGSSEQEAYDGKWFDQGLYKTYEEIREVIKNYGGNFSMRS